MTTIGNAKESNFIRKRTRRMFRLQIFKYLFDKLKHKNSTILYIYKRIEYIKCF